jgi:hypothetical protein
VTGVAELDFFAARVRQSASLPELLGAGSDAFEAIRSVARACEDRTPELFAAFMMAAGTATEARNALTGAPSLPPGHSGTSSPGLLVAAAADVDDVADELADLAGLLARRLPDVAAEAPTAGDRVACHDAALAAAEIHQLLTRDSGETLTG